MQQELGISSWEAAKRQVAARKAEPRSADAHSWVTVSAFRVSAGQ